MKVVHYGRTSVEIHPTWLQVRLPDGQVFQSCPNDTEEDRTRAAVLGYEGGDVVAMTLEHDRLHALLAYALGMDESPALRSAVLKTSNPVTDAEEQVILSLQAFLNLCRRYGYQVHV